MRFSSVAYIVAFALGASALPADLDTRAAPTIYLAGDSTMANKGANDGATDGK
jgi:rhamnogalacturonan acetylesterase